MSTEVLNQTAQGHLKSIVERAERLEADKAEIAETLKELFHEAAGQGFDPKVIRKVLKLRKIDRARRQEEEAILETYLSATGDL